MDAKRATCMTLLAICLSARADTVTLQDGSVLTGNALVDHARLCVQLTDVEDVPDITIPLEMVASINGSEVRIDPLRLYEKKLQSLIPGDVEGYRALANWCAAQGLRTEEELLLGIVIGAAPDDQEARRRLGHARYQGYWMSAEDLVTHRLGGLIKVGDDWLAAPEVAKLMLAGKVKLAEGVMRAAGYFRVRDEWQRPEDLLAQGYLFVDGTWGRALQLESTDLARVLKHPRIVLPERPSAKDETIARMVSDCMELRECLLRGAAEGLSIPADLAERVRRHHALMGQGRMVIVTPDKDGTSQVDLATRLLRDNDTLALMDLLYLTDTQTAALFNICYETCFVNGGAAKKVAKVLNQNQMDVLTNYMGYGGVPPSDILAPLRAGQATADPTTGTPPERPPLECFCYEHELEELTKVPDGELKPAVSSFVNSNYLPVIKNRYPDIAWELSKKREFVVDRIMTAIRTHKQHPFDGQTFGWGTPLAGEVHPKKLANEWKVRDFLLQPTALPLYYERLKRTQAAAIDRDQEVVLTETTVPGTVVESGGGWGK